MTNEEAVKMLRTMQRTVYLGNRKFEDAIECAIKALSEPLQPWEVLAAQSVLSQPEPHWIPVTERLPEEETDVLVTVHFLGLKRTHRNGWNEHIKESFYVEVASHINGEWSSVSDEYKIAKDRHKVVAYMPLPEPYEGVTE